MSDPVQRGRYALHEGPGGGLVIARTTSLCESCAGCGCGDQAEPVTIPAALVAMAKAAAEGKIKLPSVRQLKALSGSKGPVPSGRH